jgi:hypothetical protein
MEKYIKVIDYIVATQSYHGQTSKTPNAPSSGKLCLPLFWINAIRELSTIIGEMKVYSKQEYTKHVQEMVTLFEATCDKYDIDSDDFELWYEDNKGGDEPKSEDTNSCTNCTE